jgi:hypothetical protein
MASYTFTPIPPVDTINSHAGFYILAVFIGFIILVWWAFTVEAAGRRINHSFFILMYILIMAYPAYYSWHSGEIKVYKNEVITAELTGFWGENHQENVREGKNNRVIDVHNQFVMYKTPDGIISFKMNPNTPYPEKAILYRN